MIQRIQSLLLFISAITTACFLFVFPFYISKAEVPVLAMDNTILLILGALSLVLSLATIFMFKDRKRQMSLSSANMVLILATCGWIIYTMYTIQDQIKDAGLGTYSIAISYIMVSFARRNIKKDQDLVASVDRVR